MVEPKTKESYIYSKQNIWNILKIVENVTQFKNI